MSRKPAKVQIPVDPGPPPTPTKEEVRQALVLHLLHCAAGAKADLTRFASDFAKDALRALEQSASAFESAAELDVIKQVTDSLDKGTDIKHILTYATGEALRQTRSTWNSTSVPPNFARSCSAAAWSRMACDLKGFAE